LPALYKYTAYKVAVLLKRQPRSVQIGALTLVCLTLIGGITLAYASLFTARPAGSQATSQQKTGEAGKLKNVSMPTTTKSSTTSTNNPSSAPGSAVVTNQPPVYPSTILNLTDWKLTLPIGKSNDPDEIVQPQLAGYSLPPYFQPNVAKDGVQFVAPVGGVTTSGSNFPRSELREMTDNGQKEASWSTTSGTSTLQVREAVDHLPSARPQLVAAQIHGPSAYVILIRLNGSDLFVEGDKGKNIGDLDAKYQLGSIFDLQITASNGHILVSYNGVQKVDEANSGSGDYFKAGCYTQSNPSYGDSPTEYGQTTLYSLSVSHT